MVWSEARMHYNRNIGQNEFGKEAVKKMWKK
jgi:hypothetical protein